MDGGWWLLLHINTTLLILSERSTLHFYKPTHSIAIHYHASKSLSRPNSTPSFLHLHNRLDLHRHIQRERVGAHGRTRVLAPLAQRLSAEVFWVSRRAIDFSVG